MRSPLDEAVGAAFKGGAQTFIHKGTNGRWRDELSAADSRSYEETAYRELGEECANGLATGRREAGGSAGHQLGRADRYRSSALRRRTAVCRP